MKKIEKDKAIILRKQGMSMNEIVDKLNVAKSSVSLWVRDIELTEKQKQQLSRKGHTKGVIEKRRIARLTNEQNKRNVLIDNASEDIGKISKRDLFILGVALYWGEGAKKRNVIQFTNSDSRLIRIMMRFLKEVCEVPEIKFRGHIHLHTHLDSKKAEKYWSLVSGIKQKQLYKTSQQHNKASKNKKDSLPNGTFNIYVCDTKLALSMKGWMNGLYKNIIEQ